MNSPIYTFYLVPGLGADDRLFNALDLGPHTIVHLPRIAPLSAKESLESYAKRLADYIDTSQPFVLLGVSLGGLLCVELSKILQPHRTILISSAKTYHELPRIFNIGRWLKLHKLIGTGKNWPSWLLKLIFGYMDKKQFGLFFDMLIATPDDFSEWSKLAVLGWYNTVIPPNIIHIHGTKDKVIPFKNLKNVIPIPGGTHIMVLRKGKQISRIILDAL